MNKILVIPNNLNYLEKLKNKKIDGLIFSIKDLSVNNNLYLTIDDIKKILLTIDKNIEIWISLNKIMHNNDLELLEHTLIELDKLKITGVMFYDLSVINICKRLNLNLKLSIHEDHLNASIGSNNFYYKQGVDYTVITNDITLDEILEIKEDTFGKYVDNIIKRSYHAYKNRQCPSCAVLLSKGKSCIKCPKYHHLIKSGKNKI